MLELDYVDHMGSDLRTVNAARVSFDKYHVSIQEDRDPGLINYLGKHGHWTPAAHNQLTCKVRVPIFIARQWYKHQIGAVYNEISRRYVEDTPSFFYPDSWRQRPPQSIKQGSAGALSEEEQDQVGIFYELAIDTALKAYEHLLEMGVAPEQARIVLPQSMMTEFYVTGSLVYWARLYQQRTNVGAQQEWKQICNKINQIAETHFPLTWRSLIHDDK